MSYTGNLPDFVKKYLQIEKKTLRSLMALLKFLHLQFTFYHFRTFTMAYKISEDCIACGSCIDECPVDAIFEGDIYFIDPEICSDCGSCVEVCPVECISLDE